LYTILGLAFPGGNGLSDDVEVGPTVVPVFNCSVSVQEKMQTASMIAANLRQMFLFILFFLSILLTVINLLSIIPVLLFPYTEFYMLLLLLYPGLLSLLPAAYLLVYELIS
jgi:hypothetical protein